MKLFILLLISYANAYWVCTFQSGDLPKLRYKGDTAEDAMYRTSKECLSLRIQKYTGQRTSTPTTERMILFAEDCVNKTYCKEESND